MGEDPVARNIRLTQERRAKKEAEFTERSLAQQAGKVRDARIQRALEPNLRRQDLLKVKIRLMSD